MWTDGPLELILHIPSRVDPIGIMLDYVNFAGEHCSRLGSGLQGACESAEEAAIQIMNRLSKA